MSGKELRPTHVHIVAPDEESRQRGRRLVSDARVLLAAVQHGADLNGVRRSYPDGSLIQVAAHVAGPLVATIRVPPLPKTEPEEKKPQPEEPRDFDYLWIGIRVCWEDIIGTPFPERKDFSDTPYYLEMLDSVLEAPDGEYCSTLRYGFPSPNTYSHLWNDGGPGAPHANWEVVSYKKGKHEGVYEPINSDGVPPFYYRWAVGEHKTISHTYDVVWSLNSIDNYPPATTSMGGEDPVGRADMDYQVPGNDILLPVMPLEKQVFEIGGTKLDPLYDFWADSGENIMSFGKLHESPFRPYPLEDCYSTPIVLSPSMYAANSNCNPDIIARATKVIGWVPNPNPDLEITAENGFGDDGYEPDDDFIVGWLYGSGITLMEFVEMDPFDQPRYTEVEVFHYSDTAVPRTSNRTGYSGNETENVTGQLRASVNGRNWTPTHQWSPHESSPYDPMPGDEDGYPWQVTYVVDPNPGIPPGDNRENLLIESRDLGVHRPTVRRGEYVLHLAGRSSQAGSIPVEVAIMCGKNATVPGTKPTVRKLQKLSVPCVEAGTPDSGDYPSQNKHVTLPFTMKIRLDAIRRTIEDAESDDTTLSGINPSEYTGHLTYTT